MSDERRTSATPGRAVPWTVALDVRAADVRAAGGALDPLADLDEAQRSDAPLQVMAAAAQRLEKFDAAVCEALHDAPVPDDLEARLFALLAAEQAAAGGLAWETSAETAEFAKATLPEQRALPEAAESSSLLAPPKRLTLGQRLARRPWFMRVSLATAAALLVGVASFALREPHASWTAASLEAAIRELHAQARPAASHELHLWPDYPLSRYVSPRQAVASQTLPAVGGLSAAAYQLRSARGATATLYVLKCPPQQNAAAWAPAPDRRPLFTQGVASCAWREDEQLYVLVVDGNERDYLEFLRFQDAAVG